MNSKLFYLLLLMNFMMLPATSQATTLIFSEDFSSGSASAEFSGQTNVVSAGGFVGSGGFADNFLHNFAEGNPAPGTYLNLTGLLAHTQITIQFDLALIDSWDGSVKTTGAFGPFDFLNLTLDGVEIFEISVDNAYATRPEIVPSTATELVKRTELFGSTDGAAADSAYAVLISIAHVDSNAAFAFFADGVGWQGSSDESWAIDNIVISTDAVSPVPVPAALPLFGTGLAIMGFLSWNRKRKARLIRQSKQK